jgi:hypothetical protein
MISMAISAELYPMSLNQPGPGAFLRKWGQVDLISRRGELFDRLPAGDFLSPLHDVGPQANLAFRE